MTLLELSAQYEKSAQLLRVRLSELRRQKKTAEDRQELRLTVPRGSCTVRALSSLIAARHAAADSVVSALTRAKNITSDA